MISVSEALDHILSLVKVTDSELVDLANASGRVLAKSVSAQREQPPFAASAMDGYAVRSADIMPGARLTVIGESAAGSGYEGEVTANTAVRIFTGAPVPKGADRVVIQEDVTRDGDIIVVSKNVDLNTYIRPKGDDFSADFKLAAPKVLSATDIALLAAMNVAQVPVRQRPDVAILMTGDELVMPGETPSPDQIIASNGFALKALLEDAGALVRLLPIARDNEASLKACFELAQGADLIITIGGASVGDHDLVGPVAEAMGLERSFYKVAMRPGKPLMAGRMGESALIGLPGNPVSSIVCGYIFVLPYLRTALGFDKEAQPRKQAVLGCDMPANGPREHYMRAILEGDNLTPMARQDSALLSVLAQANALAIRPPRDPARSAGETVEYIPL